MRRWDRSGCCGARGSGRRLAIVSRSTTWRSRSTLARPNGLLGPNGAGKTTTISMICGLLTRDAALVTLQGRELDTAVGAGSLRGEVARTLQS